MCNYQSVILETADGGCQKLACTASNNLERCSASSLLPKVAMGGIENFLY